MNTKPTYTTLHTAMQELFNTRGSTPILTTYATTLCNEANTFQLSEGEKQRLVESVCEELAMLLQAGLK